MNPPLIPPGNMAAFLERQAYLRFLAALFTPVLAEFEEEDEE